MQAPILEIVQARDEAQADNIGVPFAYDEATFDTESPADKVSAKKQRAILLMLEGQSVTEVGRVVRVHRSTVHRWLLDPGFKRELSLRREAFFEQAFDLQAYGAVQGTLKLVELLDSKNERVSLGAASRLASFMRDYVAVDQERRIRIIEDEADLFESTRRSRPGGRR